jgi:hypothetical protein
VFIGITTDALWLRRYRHVARVQREVLGSVHCSSCLAMWVRRRLLLSSVHFIVHRYNLGAFLLVHRPSQLEEAAALLRSAHSVRWDERF